MTCATVDPTCLKSFARKKHSSGFYLKWKLFPRVMSAAEIQTPAQLSALKTGLWAPSKYCDCTCRKQRKAVQQHRHLKDCIPALKLRGFWNWGAASGKRNNYLLSSPLPAPYLQPVNSLLYTLFEIICLSLGSLPLYFNWGWQVRHKVKELEITCKTKTVEPKRQPFS